MRVLMLEDRPGAAAPAAWELEGAGHQALDCGLDADGRCVAVRAGGRCPLDDGPVDAAVTSACPDGPAPPGLICALRRSIPVVPLAPARSTHAAGLTAAVERAATQAPPGHTALARAAARATLDRHGHHDVGVRAAVDRAAGQLHIRLTTDGPVPPSVGRIAAVRTLAAVRAADSGTRCIGVSVTVRPGDSGHKVNDRLGDSL
jgi:hypothetical protein